MAFQGLRQLFFSLGEPLFYVIGRAIQIVDWDRNHQFCGRCSTLTEIVPGERARKCPQCGLSSYPRLSPAMIVRVERNGENGQEILLARANRFPPGFYSVLAGFVEPGETLEQCVEREVKEEVGIEVKNIRYFGSQSWPFPNSLMIAFTAEYASGNLTLDPSEILDAGWYSPDSLPQIPPSISIARRLIDDFVDRQK
jgi:NAD+ diphosphatase